MLLGTNRDEGSLFVDVVITDEADFDAWAARQFGAAVATSQGFGALYRAGPAQPFADWWLAAGAAAGDFSLICPTRRAAIALGEPVIKC